MYDVIVVLGAVMQWDTKTKRWTFPTIVDRYAGKLVMGKARALAAREIQNLAPMMLVTGGSDVNPETGKKESRAVELSKLITEKYKVPKEKVMAMGQADSGHTVGNVENVVEYIKARPGTIERGVVAILSPRFQLKRAKLLFDANPFFKINNIELKWLVVEDVLGAKSQHFQRWANRIYSTPEAEINKRMEEKGVTDLGSGQYKPKS